jgi:outer membrane protein assembly factor BamB
LKNQVEKRIRHRASLVSLLSLACVLLSACSSGAANQVAAPAATHVTPTAIKQGTDLISWPAFDGGGARSGVNSAEKTITPANVHNLMRFWQTSLPDIVDSSPIFLPNVQTSEGSKSLLFMTSLHGTLLAVDASNGKLVWQKQTSGPKFTTSSPVLDPSGQFVYSYGLDGKVHKYAAGTGDEITSDGWPITITLMPDVEKGSSSLNITQNYLYMITSGYPGDAGHYEGHIVAIQLATGRTTVFNSLCANLPQLLNNTPSSANYCPDVQSGAWGRAGAVVDPVTGNVFFTTGNGDYTANVGGHDYGDTVLELTPDLSRLVDSYTPANYNFLQQNDLDLSSASPAMLPTQAGSKTPYLAVQLGKDGKVRLLNRQNLSGQGGPNHVGGEVQTVNLPQGCTVPTHPAVWNDSHGQTWIFVANNCGFSAFKVLTAANGTTSLQVAYSNKQDTGSSPFIANGLLFLQDNNVLRVLNPTDGNLLWSSNDPGAHGSIGSLHWQSPLVVNGVVYVPDDNGNLTAYALPI